MEDIRQNEDWAKCLVEKGWKVVRLRAADKIHTMQAAILPLGIFSLSMLKLQRSEYDPNWSDLKKIKKENRVVSSIIEPIRVQDPLAYKMAGYKISNFPYLATMSTIVDLTKSTKDLWEDLSENAKRMILKNKEVEIVEVSPEKFLSLWKVSSKIWTLKLNELMSMKNNFGDKVKFTASKKGDSFQSGILLLKTRDTVNYYHTWTSREGRNSGAHYKLVWESILRAKSEGLKYYDFEGIFDPRWPQKRWKGFTEFKRKFGGNDFLFPGTFFRWM